MKIKDFQWLSAQWESLTSAVAHVGAFMGSKMLIPAGVWPPGARAVKGGEGRTFLGFPGYSFICVYTQDLHKLAALRLLQTWTIIRETDAQAT